ncbi:MAG: HAD family hydrolase [Oscillospiraceae bacterium]|nr:HAD family hydrolase [Oscillospiraceae bacterium]
MKKRLSDIEISKVLLITDVDGTLLNDFHELTDTNIAAINALRAAGGAFTIATGRGVSMARLIAEKLDIDCPAVIFNGAAVYDFKKNKQLWCCSLKPETKNYIELVFEKFPTCAIEILRGDDVYLLRNNALEEKHLSFGKVIPIETTLDEIPPTDWQKVLFIDCPENIDSLIDFTQEHCSKNACWVRSAPVYYELLPENVNKGSGMLKMLPFIGDGLFTVAAGDFMNDIELLEYADMGIAVDNAEESVKAVADMVVTHNNNHAISEIIDYIFKNVLKRREEITKDYGCAN